jgi:hypothetical protein
MIQHGQEGTEPGVSIDTMKDRMSRLSKTQAKVEDKLNHHLDRVSGHECRALFEYMQAKLPRELRDMVYANICYQIGYYYLPKYFPKYLRQPSNCQLHTTAPKLHQIFRSPWNHLSKDIYHSVDGVSKRELAESWYRHTTFTIAYGCNVSNFFDCDI